jgi:hypothetical protein
VARRTELCEDGEYSAEANAMLYLNNRVIIERLRRAVFNGIRHNTELYAKGFDALFRSPDRNGFRRLFALAASGPTDDLSTNLEVDEAVDTKMLSATSRKGHYGIQDEADDCI